MSGCETYQFQYGPDNTYSNDCAHRVKDRFLANKQKQQKGKRDKDKGEGKVEREKKRKKSKEKAEETKREEKARELNYKVRRK